MNDEITWTLAQDDIDWKFSMPNGQLEDVFNHDMALAHLLLNQVVFMSNHWWEQTWPDVARQAATAVVNCSDTFACAGSDAEALPFGEIEPLYRLWRSDPMWGSTAWVVRHRRIRPIPQIESALRRAGYDVDSWGLPERPR
ncbi:MAG: hypothetical protein ACTHU0_27910 [Kofleriaceae bacterium]